MTLASDSALVCAVAESAAVPEIPRVDNIELLQRLQGADDALVTDKFLLEVEGHAVVGVRVEVILVIEELRVHAFDAGLVLQLQLTFCSNFCHVLLGKAPLLSRSGTSLCKVHALLLQEDSRMSRGQGVPQPGCRGIV